MQRLVLVVFCLTSYLFLNAQNIAGDIQVCVGDCHVYKMENGQGGPYLWSVDAGDLEVNQGDSIYVCWTETPTAEITVFDLSAPLNNNRTDLLVDVFPSVDAKINFPLNSTCTLSDSIPPNPQGEFPPIECRSACKNSTLTYFAQAFDNTNYSWVVQGGQVISTSDNELTVQWGDQEPAFLQLNVENQIGCADSIRYCIELFDKPDLSYTVHGMPSLSTSICAGQQVDLTASSMDASEIFWFTDNGQTATGVNASFEFGAPGTYQVTLVGSSNCLCSDTLYHEVVVDANPGPEIHCGGTICAGVEQNYYTDAICGNYMWNVSANATIVSGGSQQDNYISIIWNAGPEGEVSLSTTGCSDTYCAETTVLSIPVIDGNAYISGPTVVCAGNQNMFTAPYYEGTTYNWSITGNGYINEGAGTNEIIVQWENHESAVDSSIIRLEINNCYLECDGVDELHVDVKHSFIVSGELELCEDRPAYFNAVQGYDGVEVDWELSDNAGTVLESASSTSWFNPTMSYGVGIFEIQAVELTGTFCNDTSTVYVEVIERPEPISEILGPEVVCLNRFQKYSLAALSTNYVVEWSVFDGSNVSNFVGSEIYYQWISGGPYLIEVRVVDSRTNCFSTTFSKAYSPVDDGQILSRDTLCVNQIDIYELDGGITEDVEWEIIPPNAGTLRDLKNGKAEVQWTLVGQHEIRATYCSKNFSKLITVEDKPSFMVMAPDAVCEGELADISITAPADVTVEFFDDDTNLISTSLNFQVPAGRYYAVATSALGCSSKYTLTIHEYSKPNVTISTPGEVVFAGPVPFLDLYALNSTMSYTYEWFLNGVPFGGNTDVITINQEGSYHLVVTDHNGCTAQSNAILVIGFSTPDPCFPIGKIEFTYAQGSQCNHFDFFNTSVDEVPNSLSYDFGDPSSGTDNSSLLENPSHDFTNAGFFPVVLAGLLENSMPPPMYCLAGYREFVEVPLVADFDYFEVCAGEAMTFEERTSFLPGNSIAGFAWDFGDPTSGSDNISNDAIPTHIFDQPGMYLVTLEVRASSGCISTESKLIEVVAPTPADFDLPSTQCADTGIKFIGPNDPEILEYWWDFGDPASGAANQVNAPDGIHLFASAGTYTVSLTTQNIRGCLTTIQKDIDISMASLSGDISADKTFPICYGESVNLTAPSGGLVYLWSDGQSGQTITVDQAGLYSVTITDSQVCDYSPDAIFVEQLPNKHFPIRGYMPDPGVFNYSYFLDSMEICEGDPFGFNTKYDFNVNYQWMDGSTGFNLDNGDLGNLPIGRHTIELTVTDKNTGCEYPTDPFILKVNELPDTPVIVSDQSDMCEGKIFTFSVSNPQVNTQYYWSNQGQGNSIEAIAPGTYWVTAVNEFGCEKRSNFLSIYALPDAGIFNGGCREVCFPDTFCLANPNQFLTYQWIYNGSDVAAPEGNAPDFVAQAAGDYQLVVENLFGCTDSSEILTLDPLPSSHYIHGRVYMDENKNMAYDAGEELLEDAELSLWANMLLLETKLTDVLGEYEFDNINENEVRVVLNGTMLNLEPGTTLEYIVNFTKCNDTIRVDFPVNRMCTGSSESLDYFVCENDQITHDAVVLNAGDSEVFTYQNVEGCDSTVSVNVFAHSQPELEWIIGAACIDGGSGTLDIINNSGDPIQIAVDDPSLLSTNLSINNISAGIHELIVIDPNACEYRFAIDVPMDQEPDINIDVVHPCQNLTDGSIMVTSTNGLPFQYSIDGITFSTSGQFDDMGAGTYEIFVDNGSCIHDYQVELVEGVELLFTAQDPIPSCDLEEMIFGVEVSQSQGTVNYEWSHGSSDDLVSVTSEGIYSLTITDDCSTEILEWDVEQLSDPLEDLDDFPNIFSPNNDGSNDCLTMIHPSHDVLDYEFHLFDRWGELLFYSDDRDFCWDGRFNGEDAESGVYVWILEMRFISCSEEKSVKRKGDVTLVR